MNMSVSFMQANKQPMRGTWPEREVSRITGIDNVDFCRSVLERMFDDHTGLGHLTKEQFAKAAIIAAWDMFPKVMASMK